MAGTVWSYLLVIMVLEWRNKRIFDTDLNIPKDPVSCILTLATELGTTLK